MKVKDLMSVDAIKHCTPETKLSSVAKIMKENNRGALPVIDHAQKVVGIITDRDVCLSLAAQSPKTNSELAVRDVIAKAKLHTVAADQPLADALQEMRKNKVGRLPVTDKEGKLKGMISINNILTHALTHDGKLGKVSAPEENLSKTIKTLFERNNSQPEKKGKGLLELETSDE